MGQCTIDAMKKAFGTSPKDLITCIGPSICQDCFEVGEEVAEAFMESFKPEWHNEIIAPGKRPDKYQLDLWRDHFYGSRGKAGKYPHYQYLHHVQP